MDFCTIVEFSRALQSPDKLFTTLTDLVAELSTLTRTKHFAECRATIMGRKAIIYAPITPKAMDYAMRASVALACSTRERSTTPFEIHGAEMCCGMELGRRCSIIVEYPLRGSELHKVLHTMSHDRLQQGLEELITALSSLDISHNHLTHDNIIVDNLGNWHTIRQYYSSKGVGGDTETFKTLRATIAEEALADGERLEELREAYNDYCAHEALIIENRKMISEASLIGFANESGQTVVECQYLWASDFAEGRAMVMTAERRMGLIDYEGNYIIEPIYDEVIYDVDSGNTEALLNGESIMFNYRGERI